MIHLLFSLFAFAFIPPSSMILKRTVENSGSATYAIEQEVQMSLDGESFTWREHWLVENERTLRLTVYPVKDQNNNTWSFQAVYVSGQRWILNPARRTDSQKISEEFLERWFHFRNPENMVQHMIYHKMMSAAEVKKMAVPAKPGAEIKYEPESFLRLSRSQGVVNYAFGDISESATSPRPGLWIEQDQFLVRKVRLLSLVEISAEDYAPYAKGLSFPKVRNIKWSGPAIQIKTLSVVAKSNTPANQFQASSLNQPTQFDGVQNSNLKNALEEFYSRLR